MAYPDWINEDGVPYELVPFDTRNFRGYLLHCATASGFTSGCMEIIQQDWKVGLFRIGCRVLHFYKGGLLRIREPVGLLRLEAVLTGELNIVQSTGELSCLRQGQYHLTNAADFRITIGNGKGCTYFVAYYAKELLREFDIEETDLISPPKQMSEKMMQVIQDAMHHPHAGKVADIYYRNLSAEMLFLHLTAGNPPIVKDISERDLAAIYEADAILSRDLSEHYSIIKLSAMAGTNAFKLKRGFRLVFKMGVFARLLYRRMEHAKLLLETTTKPVKEVAYESGYSTVGGFINAFRKKFGLTPLDWREQKSRTC